MGYRHDGFWQPMDTLRDKMLPGRTVGQRRRRGNAGEAQLLAGRRVLVTGHTGFKGGWLALWLHQLGAEVTGFALPRRPAEPVRPDPRSPSSSPMSRATSAIAAAFEAGDQPTPGPNSIFHLAAQPLVRASYADPVETYATNVMGTVHLLDAAAAAIDGVRGDRLRHQRQMLRKSRMGLALSRDRPDGRARSLQQQQGCAEIAVASVSPLLFRATARCSPRSARAMSSAAATGPRTGWSPTSSAR